jgi:hypothetical protein
VVAIVDRATVWLGEPGVHTDPVPLVDLSVVRYVGPVEVRAHRERDGTFGPKIVRKQQRRLTAGEASALAEVRGGKSRGKYYV